MSGIKFGSINTGLPPNIVDQLMEAERFPIKTMEANKSKLDAKSKLVDELQTKIADIRKGMGDLANTRGFSDIKLTSADAEAVTGTVDPNTYEAGNWNLEVLSLAEKASAVSNGFPDKDKTKIGTGYFRFKTPNGNKDVYVPKNQNSLQGAMKAINAANVGVKASIINDRKDPDAAFKLVLASDSTGKDKSIEYPRVYMLDGDQDFFFDKEVPAKNGKVKIDGFEFEIAENVLKDAIPGVTLDLKQANPGKAVNITVKEDIEAVGGKIKTFVDSMNGVLTFLQTQNKLDKNTDTSKTLGGDSIIRNVEQRFRQLIQSPQMGVKGNVKTLSQLGVSFNRQGTLDFDRKKFDAALGASPKDVAAFFVGDGYNTGLVASVKREVNSLLNPSMGAVANKSKNLKSQADSIDQRIVQKERQLEKKESTLRDKFARLEETMSKIKSQGGAVGAMGNGGGLMGVS